MSFPRYFSRRSRSGQSNRAARRAKKDRPQPRLTFCRPYLEYLEDRIAPTIGTDLSALQGATGTVGNFASSLQSGPLNQSLPIVSGGTSTLSQILGLSSPFQTISTALSKINTDPNTTNSASALQSELGPGFTVTDFNNNNDGIIAVKYTQSVTTTPSLSVATNPTDFFGSSSNNYFSKIVSLTGSANGQFSPDATFSFTFGADDNGFFVSPGTVFSSNDFKANLNLNGTVNIGQSVFSVAANGTGTIDLQNINLAITQQVSGSSLSNIGQSASFSVGSGSNAKVMGDFKARVLGTPLVEWSPTISWTFASNGALQAAQVNVPTSGAGAPSFIQGGESSVETAMLNSLTDSLGLSKFGVLLDPLAQVPSGLQDIINFVTSLTQSNLDAPQLNPTTGLDQLVSGNNNGQNSSYFTPASASDLVDFAEGKPGVNLITFATPKPVQFLDIPLNIDLPGVPIASFLGLINLTLGGGLGLTFTGSASFGVGLDSNGLFVNTDPSVTNITFGATAGAGITVALDVAGIDTPGSLTVGPEFGTKAILEMQPAANSKLYLSTLVSNIDQSGALSGLGTWLGNNLQLEVDLTGDIKVDLQINTPVGGLIQGLPGPVGDLLKAFAGGIQEFTDFLSGAVEDVCNVVNDVTSFFGLGSVLDCQTVRKVSEITFGQYLQILAPFFQSIGADFVVTNDGQTGDAIWKFQLFDVPHIFKGSQITSGQGNSNTNDSATQSDPNDFIGYQVSGSTLTITGAAGTDNIQVKDLGNGQIQLLRSGIDAQGNAHTDPTRNFTGITQINVTMNDSSGTNDSFVMDSSLNINTTVTGGAGNEKIVTGAGDDTINANDGNDDLEGGNGTNHINAGNGNDTFVGGSGTDVMKGGSGTDLFEAGSGTETMTGGTGADTFVAGSGTDVAHGGGGNDTFQGGSGNATFYGEGGPNDSDLFYGGSGTVIAYGSAASSDYVAGSGTMTVHGGPGQDEVLWQDGDGNVTFDGGGAPTGLPDFLQATGGAGSDTFTATANGTGISIAAPGATLTATNIQELNLNGAGGADNITVHDLSGTTLQFVAINFGEIGNPDNALDTTTLYGPSNTTVNINEIQGTESLVQPPQPGQEVQVTTVSGPVMQITGLGPTVVVPNDEDAVNVNPGGSNTVNINTQTMHGSLTVNGGSGVNQFNVQAISGPTTINTTGGQNTINVGSKAPGTGGVLSGIVAALTLNGSGGADTANVDDTGDTSPQSGTLTPTTLTGLGMGPSGITYSNLAALNISLGSGGNSFAINVPSGSNLPATTTVNGGTSNNDSLMATYGQDMNGSLILTQFEQSNIQIGRDLNGYLSDTAPGSVQLLSIGRSLTSTGQVVAGSIDTMTIGPNQLTPGDDMAGQIIVSGTLTLLRVAGGTPGTIVAGLVGQVLVYGGYGPVVSQIKENGIQRSVEAAVPANPYPLPNPPGQQPPPNDLPNVFFQYIYEGTSNGLANPQLTVRVANNASAAPDQYDLSLVVYNDTAKFNLARLDAVGVSGIRNVDVEGDLLTSVSTAAANFFTLPTGGIDLTPAGVRLPLDHLAGVGVRDFAPNHSIQAASIQGVAFGSYTEDNGCIGIGATADVEDAEELLGQGTRIVQANDTFRVPFADLPTQQVGFFFDDEEDSVWHSFSQFDDENIAFTVQSVVTPNPTNTGNVITPSNVARGAATALVTVMQTHDCWGHPEDSVVRTINVRGDGASIRTEQYIAGSITSTGPLGDLILESPQGITNVTAPSIFGNVISGGPITGTIQTTGQRADPITGVVSTVSADFGRVYVAFCWNIPFLTTTVVQAQGCALSGQLISRGNFLSQIVADGGISGVVAAQGNLGTQIGGKRLGGILSNGSISGEVMVLGNVLGDIVAHGGLKGGRIAVQGSLLGNTVLDGGIDACSALVAGGSIGNAAACTGLIVGNVKGILAANGNINLVGRTNTSRAAFYKADLNSTDPTSAAVIDSIFTSGFGLDLSGLALMLQNLEDLSVNNGELVLI